MSDEKLLEVIAEQGERIAELTAALVDLSRKLISLSASAQSALPSAKVWHYTYDTLATSRAVASENKDHKTQILSTEAINWLLQVKKEE